MQAEITVGTQVRVTWEGHIFPIVGDIATIAEAPPKHGGGCPDRDDHYWAKVDTFDSVICIGKPDVHFEVLG